MQTLKEYKEYAKQLEGELHNKNKDMKAYMTERDLLLKDNVRLKHEVERLERERVDQNAIIETCANELEDLRKHEFELDAAKAKIKELENKNKWHRCDKPNEDGFYDLPAEDGEYIVQVEFDGKLSVTSSEFDPDESDWPDLHVDAKVIQWREMPKALEVK